MIGQIVGGIVRAILAAVGGNLAGQGWISNDEVQAAIGAILTLGAIAWSVWQKSRKRTVPGGAFNPQAEVRKPRRVSRNFPGNLEGFARPTVLAVLCVVLLIVGQLQAAFVVDRYGPAAAADTAIRYADPVDSSGFLMRLFRSLQWTAQAHIRHDEETGAIRGRISAVGVIGSAEI